MDLKLREAIADRHGSHWVYLIKIGHPDGDRFFNTGFRNVDYDAGDGLESWRGVGLIAKISLPTSSAALQVERMTLSLAHIRSEFSYLTEGSVHNNELRIWVAYLRHNGRVRATDELVGEDGRQDIVRFTRSQTGETGIDLEGLAKFAFLATRTVGRWTPEHQRIQLEKLGIDPDSDTGFDEMSTIADQNTSWVWEA